MTTKILATADKKTSDGDNIYSLFIGRWQPWHAGHRWLIDQRLNAGKKVCIAIRDVMPDKKNPFPPMQVKRHLEEEALQDLVANGQVKIIIIPDIESVNFGRGVGYDIIEHVPPTEISDISATKIRASMGL